MTAATIGDWVFSHAAAELEEVLTLTGLGKSNSLVDATNFQSPAGTMEYIAGLADGSEITVTCNYIHDGIAQLALVADVDSQATAAFTLANGANTTYSFSAVCMSYSVVPSVTDQNQIEFGLKVSGDITAT